MLNLLIAFINEFYKNLFNPKKLPLFPEGLNLLEHYLKGNACRVSITIREEAQNILFIFVSLIKQKKRMKIMKLKKLENN